MTGYILPVKEIFEEGKKYNSINVLDTAQSLGLVPVRGKELNADIIAFAGHKTLYGPFGIGGFFNLSNVPLLPVVTGGTGTDSLNLHMPEGPEAKYEAASENIVAIAGLNAALGCLNQEALFQHESELTEWLISILSEIKQVTLLVPPIGKRVGIVSFTVNSLKSDDVGTILDQDFDIAVRTGYHCAPYIHKYLRDENKMGTVRASLGQYNTQEDIHSLISAIKELVM